VAVGPCGHREVCANCAVRMRFFDRNWQRSVSVARSVPPWSSQTQTLAALDPSSSRGIRSRLPRAAALGRWRGAGGQVLVGVAAYFDNPEQYEKARLMCLRSSSSSLHHHPAPRDEGDALPDDAWVLVLIGVVGIVGGLLNGLPVALHLQLQHWHHRIQVVLAFGFLYGAIPRFLLDVIHE
jgi:hypothetical protein